MKTNGVMSAVKGIINSPKLIEIQHLLQVKLQQGFFFFWGGLF